jgi:arylsulfatase A-like enzyme
LGWDDLSIHGNKIVETPHLDAFAHESKRFSQFYVNPVCAPTRSSLLTGRHFLKTGVSHVHGGKDFIHLDETIFAETFRNAGFATGMWGKWHSGKTPGYYPWERGFDEAYQAKLYDHKTNEGYLNGEHVKHAEWADEVIVNYAIDFIERNKNQPFLAYLSFLTCHAPLEAPDEFVEKYRQKGLSNNFATLYGMIEHMDFHIQRLLNSIERFNLTNNTIVIFMSDNGPAVINNLLTDDERDKRYVNEYKGHKGNIWENGVKSPLFVRWPGKIRPAVTTQLADITDVYATLLDLAAIKLPGSHLTLDGISLAPVLLEDKNITEKEYVYNYAHAA